MRGTATVKPHDVLGRVCATTVDVSPAVTARATNSTVSGIPGPVDGEGLAVRDSAVESARVGVRVVEDVAAKLRDELTALGVPLSDARPVATGVGVAEGCADGLGVGMRADEGGAGADGAGEATRGADVRLNCDGGTAAGRSDASRMAASRCAVAIAWVTAGP